MILRLAEIAPRVEDLLFATALPFAGRLVPTHSHLGTKGRRQHPAVHLSFLTDSYITGTGMCYNPHHIDDKAD